MFRWQSLVQEQRNCDGDLLRPGSDFSKLLNLVEIVGLTVRNDGLEGTSKIRAAKRVERSIPKTGEAPSNSLRSTRS